MDQHYHAAQRAFQDQFDTRRLADRLAESTSEVISEAHKSFIELRDMFFIATADEQGGHNRRTRVANPASCAS